MSITSSVAKITEALAVWLNPERKERAVLREAIQSAEQLLLILRKQDRYKDMTDAQRAKYEIHYQKRFDAWKDGQT